MRSLLTIALGALLSSCTASSGPPEPVVIASGSYLPSLSTLHSTSEPTGMDLTENKPVAALNFSTLRQFMPSQHNPLAFAVYDYKTDFQPARVTVQGIGCPYYVFIGNFAQQSWRLVASAEAGAGPTQITSEIWVDPDNLDLRDTWRENYSDSGAIYIAVVSQQSGYLQSLQVENSRDFGLRALAAYQTAEEDYHAATGQYFEWVEPGYDGLEPYVDPGDYQILAHESRNALLGSWAYVVNSTSTTYDLAVPFTRRDGGCGYISAAPNGASTEVQEPLNQLDLIAREACRSIAKQEAAYHTANGVFGAIDQLINPPSGQSRYFDERWDAGDLGMAIFVWMQGNTDTTYLASVAGYRHDFSVDESGVVSQQDY